MIPTLVRRTIIGFSTPTARQIVRDVLEAVSEPVKGLHPRQIYERAQEHCARMPPPPESALEHPEIVAAPSRNKLAPSLPAPISAPHIKSLAHLKEIVLPDMQERGQLEKLIVHRGHKDLETGARVDYYTPAGGTRKIFPSSTPIVHEEHLWFLRVQTPEEVRREKHIPPVRRPQEHGAGRGLARRRERQIRQGHTPRVMEAPEDFMQSSDGGENARPRHAPRTFAKGK
ncbi:hypothetical protein K488DRAFT_85920 [Vararia minispora EC-137]|uniref:Uncharacterized protein n=1 Tax=Vararia minispora EC-137 TaxID=1314806 RepID=A0ACB8QL24_9AGAM|nr:hypothetical protein K488DRAFT_85920 [Vararia minispora EC-137]